MSDLRYFQDRQQAIETFDHLWQQTFPWIQAFTGFSGHGKSTLLDWLEAYRCQPQRMPYALIGLDLCCEDLVTGLTALLEHPGMQKHLSGNMLRVYRQVCNQALEDLNRSRLAITQTQVIKDAPDGQQQMSANVAEIVRQMKHQASRRILEAWLDCLGGLQPGQHFVFLLDNYDAFQEAVSLEDIQSFWGVLDRAHYAHPELRVVVASRERLRYRDYVHTLQNGLANEVLGALSRTDSDALLASMGVQDVAFREAVYVRLAQGHPLITRMAGQAWLDEAGGILVKDVPRLSDQEAAVEWVHGRILERLQGDIKQAVRWAALLRWFNAESLGVILQMTISEDVFRELSQYAFIVHPRLEPAAWACHDLVRRVQMAYLKRERPEQFRQVHGQAEAYYREKQGLLDSLYHRFFLDVEGAFTTWKEIEASAAFHFDHPTWAAVMELGLSPEIELPVQMKAEVYLRAGRRHYYRAEWDLAVQYIQEALGLFRAVGDRLGEANCQTGFGDLSLNQKDYATAVEQFQVALGIYRVINARVGQTYVALRLAYTLLQIGRVEEGLSILESGAALARNIDSQPNLGSILWTLAQVHQSRQDYPEALACYEELLVLSPKNRNFLLPHADLLYQMEQYERAGADYACLIEQDDQDAQAWNGRGNVLQQQGDSNGALSAYSKAAAVDPQEVMYVRNRASTLIALGRLNEAQGSCEAASTLAPDHPYTFRRWGDLFLERGEWANAEARYRAALQQDSSPGWRFGLAVALWGLGSSSTGWQEFDAALAQSDARERQNMLRDLNRLRTHHVSLPVLAEAVGRLMGVSEVPDAERSKA